jgi:hypothetical protein
VEVTAANTAVVDMNKTAESTNITPREVEELPLVSRDIGDLAYLAPGIKQADSYDPTKNRYQILSVNGQGGRNVNVTVNGIDNKDNTVGGPVMQLPAEAVQEFQISTQRFSVVNGRSAGAAINVITKSGSNGYHGSFFGNFRDQAMNASLKVPNGDGTVTSTSIPYSRQWFGGSFGGPIKKDKLFAFFAMERQREHTSIPEAPSAQTQLALATGLGAVPFSGGAVPTPFFENRIAGRMDWTINNKHSIYLSIATQGNNSLNDQSNGTFDQTEGNFTVNHMQIANLTWNSVWSPTLVNSATIGWQYWNNLIDSTTRAPLITFPDAQFGTNTNVPQNSIQRKIQYKDDLSKTIGKHTFKGGVDFIQTPFMGGFFEFNPTLEIDFFDNPTCILGVGADAGKPGCGAGTYPNGFKTAGAVSGMSIAVGDPTFIIKDAKQIALYFQDDWKVTKNFTLNAGIRWDKDIDFVGGSDISNSRTWQELKAIASINPTAAFLTRHPAGDYGKNFSPRVGLAYDMTGQGKHVIRAGFGMYYDNTFQNIPLFMEQQANTTIFQTAFAISGSAIVPGTGIPLSSWRFGVDPLPTIPPASGTLAGGIKGGGATGRIMDPDYRNPVTEEWNFGYTWAITNKTAFEAGYVHVLGLHENKTVNFDPRIPVCFPSCTAANLTTLSVTEDAAGHPNGTGFFFPMDAAFVAAGQPALGSVRNEMSIGRSRYDGLNLSYRQRGVGVGMGNSSRLDLIVNYTLANAQGYDQDGGSFRYYPHDPTRPLDSSDFGPAFNDERHHLTVAGVLNLPWGLQFSPILQAGSARPYNIISNYNMTRLGGGSQAGVIVVPNNNLSAITTFAATDPATSGAVKLAAAQCYWTGNCRAISYDGVRGNPYFNMDARVAKNIKIKERANVQLQCTMFNLTNHANYGNNFGTTLQSSTFEKPIGFINPTSTIIPRAFIAEFGARLSF